VSTTNTNIRTAVVGVGHLGSNHAKVYAAMPDVDLVAVADVDADAAERAAKAAGATAYTDFRQIPDDVQAVSVVVPTVGHREVAEFFMKRGASVFIEKPLAGNVVDAEAIADAAAASSGTVQVGHIERFNPAMRAARPYIEKPLFIECRRVAPFSFRSTDIGVVFDLMIHDLDLVLWLVGKPPVKVDAFGAAILVKREDIVNARITFEGGCVANLTASRLATKPERTIRVFEASRYISIDTAAPRARVAMPSEKMLRGEIDVASISPKDLADPRSFVASEIINMKELELTSEMPLQAELAHFIRRIREGTAPLVGPRDGLAAVRLAEQVLEAMSREVGRHVDAIQTR
jgi:predicted dehydrogenase